MKPRKRLRNQAAEFEKVLTESSRRRFVLRLYVTGMTRRSMEAVETIKELCEARLKGRYELEIVDLYEQPDRAGSGGIIAAPTLVRELPLPLRRLIGDLRDPDRVLLALNLKAGLENP